VLLLVLASAPAAAQDATTVPLDSAAAAALKEKLPLTPDRTLAMTATEGSWMSADVSPDGRTVVFDLLGDLWTVPLTGGAATPLTRGMGFDVQPRFSPDGRHVAFVSDRDGGENVWIIALDGSDTTQVTRGKGDRYLSPEWTPDGAYVVATKGSKLWMWHREGGGGVQLVDEPANLRTVGAAFGGDDRYLWFSGRVTQGSLYNNGLDLYQLAVYDRDTGEISPRSNRWGGAFRPALSPDGRWLVYASRHVADTGLRLRELATGEERWIAYPVQRDESESRAPLDLLPGYAFTPDSEAIVVSYGGKLWRVPLDGSDAAEIPFEAEVEVGVGPEVKFDYPIPDDSLVVARQIRSPTPSPDGRWMAFTAFDRVWVKALPDGEPRRLTGAEVGEYHPAWSPDGAWVAWVSWDDAGGGHVWKARADGSGQPQRLTTQAALYYNPAWSPDGSRVVATRAAARELKKAPDVFFGPLGGEFVWVPAAGGEATRIAPTGSRDVAHFTRSDPDRIYAYSPLEGLVSFRWDGTDVKRHLRVVGVAGPSSGAPHAEPWVALPRRVFPLERAAVFGDPEQPAETGGPGPPAGLVLISPAGGEALAQVGNHIYTVGVPVLGGSVPVVNVSAPPPARPVPVRRLTDVGGEFPAWSGDGSKVHYAIGNAVFTYDLRYVEARADSADLARRAEVARNLERRALADSLKAARARVDSLKKAEAAVPDSLTARINAMLADSVELRADSLRAAAAEIERRARAITAHADSVRAGLDSVRAETDDYEPREERYRVTLPRDLPRGTVVLRGGRVLTMTRDTADGGGIVENADVVVTDSRIVAVGPRGEVEVPEGAEIVDVSGRTLIPGFVDTHYHAQWLVPEVHPQQAWQYLTNLAYGVTTTRDPQTSTTDILSYQDRVEVGGMVGPRIFSTGPGVFSSENLRNQEHAEEVLRRYSDYYDTKTLKMYMTGNRQQRQWVITAAKKLEIMPTTEGGLDFKIELTHAMDGYPGIEHALPIAPIYSDVVELFKASQTTNSPTLLVSYGGPFGENFFYATENVHDDPKMRRFSPEESLDARSRRRGPGTGGSPGQAGWFVEEDHVFPRHAEFVKKLMENGARAAVGSHGQIQGVGYHWELWAMTSGGMSNHDALRAATLYGAEAVGFGKELGSIEAGKFADILVLDADPLADIRNTAALRYVMKNGRLYQADTLDEVWPRQRALPTPPWRALGPEGVGAGVRR
ncbi:MAG: amidohydrolase family protein, partial [Longimicrobiales bacterium]|nr:amidohydrolase family protein [Longimicrobiales bacterium]